VHSRTRSRHGRANERLLARTDPPEENDGVTLRPSLMTATPEGIATRSRRSPGGPPIVDQAADTP
jgi:hypothetical protein